MSDKPVKRTVDDVYKMQWISWIITVLLIVAAAYAGIQLPPLPAPPGATSSKQPGGQYTGLDGILVSVPTTFATATPGVLVNNKGLGRGIEVQDAGTPVWAVNDGGSVSHTGDNAQTGDLVVTGALAVAGPTAQPTGTPGAAISNAGVGALLNVSGAALEYQFDATALDLQGNYLEADLGTEHLMFPSIVSTAITYTAAAGGTGAVATIADGEIWIVHDVFVNVTTNFDATGDDVTLVIGDGNDADGFTVLADAELQTTDTEATGYAAGWQGLIPATQGVYIDEAAGANSFIYAPSGAAETIDWLVDEGSGETITAGAATIYVIYTRIQ